MVSVSILKRKKRSVEAAEKKVLRGRQYVRRDDSARVVAWRTKMRMISSEIENRRCMEEEWGTGVVFQSICRAHCIMIKLGIVLQFSFPNTEPDSQSLFSENSGAFFRNCYGSGSANCSASSNARSKQVQPLIPTTFSYNRSSPPRILRSPLQHLQLLSTWSTVFVPIKSIENLRTSVVFSVSEEIIIFRVTSPKGSTPLSFAMQPIPTQYLSFPLPSSNIPYYQIMWSMLCQYWSHSLP